jgi:DNA topoisomerase-1
MSHKFDDEFGPEIFKSISASKSIQLHSEIINKKTSNIPSSNGESSSSKNGKVDPSAEASAMESSVGISKASTSNLKTYTSSPSTNSNFTSLGNKKESLFEKTIPINVDEDNNSAKHLKGDRCEDSEDEDDSILLSAMMKKNNDDGKKETPNVLKKSYDDSDDDDIPVSARLSQNIRPSKVQKRQKYGSNAIIKQERTSTLSSKRLPDKIDSLHSSRKKSKPSDQTSSINAKQISVKSEPNVEEKEAGIPLCQRTNKLATLVDKSSSLKKLRNVTKVNKGAAPSFKKKAKLKKSSNKSEHINSTKLQPSSDDGEKKWTTLVHNGVIFPPPYKPHGVKILYKGKLVTLTPDQEEVGFCL